MHSSSTQDRYKELLRLSRQWRNLQMRKRAGFGHRTDPIKPGDLAIRCPACPDPESNLPDDWKDDHEQYVPLSDFRTETLTVTLSDGSTCAPLSSMGISPRSIPA